MLPRPILLLLMPLLLWGCSAISALDSASQPLEVYELRTPQVTPARQRGVELVVEEPAASGVLAVERIMIRPAPLQAQYLPGVRWADTAPVMLQTLLLRSLTETGGFASVGRRPVGSLSDYTLLSELTDFQAETAADGDTATIRVRLIVRLVRESDARVIATRTFAVTDTAPGVTPEAILPAFDRATSRLLSETVTWVLSRT